MSQSIWFNEMILKYFFKNLQLKRKPCNYKVRKCKPSFDIENTPADNANLATSITFLFTNSLFFNADKFNRMTILIEQYRLPDLWMILEKQMKIYLNIITIFKCNKTDNGYISLTDLRIKEWSRDIWPLKLELSN